MTRPMVDSPHLFDLALSGDTPAERLSPNDRGVLVAVLVRRGMTDVQIATHTGWSYLTAVRIREDRNILPCRAVEVAA